jgi:hypothetical protein
LQHTGFQLDKQVVKCAEKLASLGQRTGKMMETAQLFRDDMKKQNAASEKKKWWQL